MSNVRLKRQKELNAQIGQVMDDFDRFEYAFATHWKKVVAVAVVIVVLVAAVVSFKVYMSYRQNAAAAAFSQALTVEALESTLAKYGSTTAAGAARLRLAGLYIGAANYDGARRELQAVSGDKNSPELAWRAALNLGYLAELEGKFDAAADIFNAFTTLSAPGNDGYRAEAYANAGRLYLKAGKMQEAREVLEAGRTLSAGSDSFGAQAVAMWMQQIAFLQSQVPAAQ